MKIASLALFVMSFSAMAFQPTYVQPSSGLSEKAGHEILNFPSIRSQDGVGLCYAFSAAQLLNHHYCAEKGLDCSKEENQLSVLEVSAYYEYYTRSIAEGGRAGDILSNFSAKRKNGLYTEKCLPFEKLAHQSPSIRGDRQGEAYRKLRGIFAMEPAKLDYEQQLCHAREIKEILPLSKDLDGIIEAYNSHTIEQFVYNVTAKDECLEQGGKVDIPQYHTQSYPPRGTKPTVKDTIEHLEKVLLNDIPVSMSICSYDSCDPSDPASCGVIENNCASNDFRCQKYTVAEGRCGGHAITITGIKEVCGSRGCKTLLKVHNSYGQSWQDQNNDGWLEAEPLIEKALVRLPVSYKFLDYISEYKKDSEIPAKSLQRTRPIPKRPAYVRPAPRSGGSDSMPSDIDRTRGPVFKCDGNYRGDKWLPGKNCELMFYTR